ncbi:hypothetical protein BDN72DRAFT_830895 [Pluteus cervinus]|uniref:Uncharacterized protein n=1 Tax=Pluteus cervinus TaxID=181527 RepID=A0ACD3BE75_9AGAR|nr:hypothetical protein BDN72DRAFT_830895 [Pluteus cervinus]
MLTHRGFSAWIVVDGESLPEYLVAVDEDAHRVSCWVPSEEGQTFSVYWKDHGGKVDTCGYITLDGLVVPGRFLFGEGTAFRQGIRSGKNAERPFLFKRTDETDDDSPSGSATKDSGMVILRIKRVNRVSGHQPNPIPEEPQKLLGKRKAGDICVGFGEEMPAYEQYTSTWTVKPYGEDDSAGSKTPSTYVSFVFRYRTKEFLEMQGILTGKKETHSVALHRGPARRVASLPLKMPSGFGSPPKKKPKIAPSSVRLSPSWRRRSSIDMRRSVSWKVIPTNTHAFPGQSMILFDLPSQLQDGVSTLDDSRSHDEEGL